MSITSSASERVTSGSKVAVYLPESLRAELTELARAGDRPLSREIRRVITEYLERRREESASS
ncbi:MAG TPA: ribbon-helix-helix protein, CopG family [Solirubrobacteraceae bacterium]|nr:ribbon-helix-helix protein, CopG family [Solirubrobacteraceae bacterium]